MNKLKERIAVSLYKAGFSANFITALGLLAAVWTGVLIYQNRLFLAGITLLLAGTLDLLDGAVARVTGEKSPFGGIFDSTLDRYGDAAIFIGTAFLCLRFDRMTLLFMTLSALTGSFLTSYVRARAECEKKSCRVGFWERGERIVFLAAALFLNNLAMAMWVLGIFTHSTALYRLLHAAEPVRFGPPAAGAHFSLRTLLFDNTRGGAAHAAKAAFFAALLLFIRPT